MALTAKYATTCVMCAQAISPGSPIASVPRGGRAKWAHESCKPETDLFGESTVAPLGEALTASSDAEVAVEGALEVWTDGACSGNPGPGGWAWATKDGREGSGGAAHTTNQRMEIQAALEAVTALEGPLVVVSDSTYVVNCFRDGWWEGWLARGWLTSARKPVANKDLWEPLVAQVRRRGTISFRWVKGHSGDPMNDRVDALAVEAAKAGA